MFSRCKIMAVPGKNIIRLDLRKCVENAKCGRKYMTYCRFFAGGGRKLVKLLNMVVFVL